jgi:hypothetical protein
VLDKRARQELATRLGEPEDDVEAHVCKIVGKSLSNVGNPYAPHERSLAVWLRGKRSGRPPFTALLYALSHAAELMVSDGEYNSANYYQRLASLTGVDHGHLSLYGKATPYFWSEFGKWLVATNYVFGRPTARPINKFQYVSLALSQAILREADRQCLHHLFDKYGFSGTDSMSEEEMSQYISAWIHTSTPTKQLKNAWSKPELRPRVCEVAVAELAEWGAGTPGVANGSAGGTTRLSLAAFFVSRFPSTRVLNLVMGRQETVSPALNLRAAGNPADKAVLGNTTHANLATLGPPSSFDLATVLARGADYSRVDGSGAFRWTTRFIVPLSRSELGEYWTEVTRVTHGVEHLVLVRAEKRIKDMVEQLLSRMAHPGYTLATPERLQGLPQGWVLYEKVRIQYSKEAVPDDLQALTPVSANSGLQVTGGLRLANGIWHSWAPPEICIDSREKEVRIEASDREEGGGTSLAVSLAGFGLVELRLGPGTVPESGFVSLKAISGEEVMATASLLLRTAEKPEPLDRQGHGVLSYRSIGTAIGPEVEPTQTLAIKGYAAESPPLQSGDTSILAKFRELSQGGEEEGQSEQAQAAQDVIASISRRPIGVAEVSAGGSASLSCVERGHHIWKIPDGAKASQGSGYIHSACKDCELSVLMPRQKKKAKTSPAPAVRSAPVQFSSSTAPTREAPINHDLLLDAVCFRGAGSWGTLESLFSGQLDEPWRLHVLARDLMLLGHLDVELEKGSGRLKRWSVPPPSLAYTGPDRAVLTGFRSMAMLNEVERAVCSAGGKLERVTVHGQPTLVEISGIRPALSREALSGITDSHKRAIHVVESTAERLASACDCLGKLFAGLAPVSTGTSSSLQRYELGSGKWRAAERISDEGAYRFQDAGVMYVYRDKDGRTLRGPNELVKLLYARAHQVRLHAYDPAARTFLSRLGCDPIGLLGRALVASSGRLPSIAGGRSVFENVPPSVAAKVLEVMYEGELP